MAEPTEDAITDAIERGHVVRAGEPRATSARYERASGRIVVELANGSTFAFPARLVQGLEQADEDRIGQVELLGAGYGLHWDALDVDLSIPGALNGIFGTAAHTAARTAPPPDRSAPAAKDGRGRQSA